MKSFSVIRRVASICLAAVVLGGVLGGVTVSASYSDVPATNSAYSQIERVSAAGIMVGDASGKFNPNNPVDKFETAKVMAIVAGYNYTNRTQAEQAAYDSAYNKWKSLINQYVKKFKLWNSTTDREIAFLLDKGFLAETDLNQFVIVGTDGVEKVRTTTKQESAVFLAKALGKGADAAKYKYTDSFADKDKISAAAKPYVYYLKSLGVFTGDDKNNFSPAANMTRASLAVVLARALDAISPGKLPAPPTAPSPAPQASTAPAPSQAPAVSPGSESASSGSAATPIQTYTPVSGTITKIYDSFSAIQITGIDANGATKIYAVATNAIIKVDGYTKAFKDLTEGMTVTCALSGSELVTVNAVTTGAAPNTTGTAGTTTAPAATPSTSPIASPAAVTTERTTIEGIVSSVNTQSNANYISIEIRILTPRNTIITETRTYSVAASAIVTRGGVSTVFSAIVKGDIVSADVSGTVAYAIDLQEKNRAFTAQLTQKRFIAETSTAVLSVKEPNGKTSDLRVAADSVITRRGVGNCAYTELRVGDTIDIKTEYDKILSADVYGNRSNVEGVVTDITISQTDGARVIVAFNDNTTATYVVIPGMFDPYLLRVGARYAIALDSAEAENFTVIQNGGTAAYTGVVTQISGGRIYIRDAASPAVVRDFAYDNNTAFTNAITGKAITAGGITPGLRVMITVGINSITLAKSITIVANQ